MVFTWILDVACQCDVKMPAEELIEEASTEFGRASTDLSSGTWAPQEHVDFAEEVMSTPRPPHPHFPPPDWAANAIGEKCSIRTKRSDKIDKVIDFLRTKRYRARAEVIEFLACNGFQHRDVNCKKRTKLGFGYTYPLHVAVAQNKPKIVVLLLQCGADASAKDSSGRQASEMPNVSNSVRASFSWRRDCRRVLWKL
mmetsp:Transcript_13992/g.33280  ORF Transcript_13992/g.33280 Transcript_13992/m.33280 type:complete len:197 (-) Transcript_13992:51-641(-)